MNRTIIVCSLLFCVLSLTVGCGGASRTTMQGVNIELPPSKEITRDTRDRFETLEHKVSLSNGKLTIDGTTYGSVQKGDKVRMTSDSKVFVNDKERSGN